MNEFTLKELISQLRASKKLFIINFATACVLGLVIGFSIPKEYSSSCTLVAEQQNADQSSLGQLASMAGINTGLDQDAIGPELYPNVVSSSKFLVDLLYVNFRTQDGDKMSYYDYLKNHQKSAWWSEATRGVSKCLHSTFSSKKKSPATTGKINPECMTEDDEGVVEMARNNIQCMVNDIDNTLSVSVNAQDPLVAKILVDSTTEHLQQFITLYRTNKARTDLCYYQTLEKEAKKKYLKAQADYSVYCDSHMNTILQSVESRRDELENELEVTLTQYNQVKTQVQMAESKVQERTPAYTIIECASVPVLASSPRKSLILISFAFLSVVFTFFWVYAKLLFMTRPDEDKEA